MALEKLEHAEARFDAAIRDTSLTTEALRDEAWRFFRRAYQHRTDARMAFEQWLRRPALGERVQ